MKKHLQNTLRLFVVFLLSTIVTSSASAEIVIDPVVTHEANQLLPSISGDKIVWVDERNGNRDIYMYDILTGVETEITSDKTTRSMQ